MSNKYTNTNYQRIQAISSHWLISCLKSPAECWRKHLDPNRLTPESTKSLNLGAAVHSLALTPQQFPQEFTVVDYERHSKAGKAHYANLTATGKTILKPSELEHAKEIVTALKENKDARRWLIYGKKERTVIQPRTCGLLPLKGRLDVHDEAHRTIVELKTTHDINLIPLALQRYHYFLSAAFYKNLVRGQAVVMIFVQTTPPHEVAVIPLERSQLREGKEQYEDALQRFDTCWQSGVWPEAEPLPDFDEDPLLMPGLSTAPQQRHQVPVGELVL